MRQTEKEPDYILRLRIEGGGFVDIICKDKTDFDKKSKFVEQFMGDTDWKEVLNPVCWCSKCGRPFATFPTICDSCGNMKFDKAKP